MNIREANNCFSIHVKPTAACNLACTACFYSSAVKKISHNKKMSEEIARLFMNQRFRCTPGTCVNIAFQGGEPTIMGLPFYRSVKEMILHEASETGKSAVLIFQTNGSKLDKKWMSFFKDCIESGIRVMLGISIDGPEHLNNKFRIKPNGAGVFKEITQAIELALEYNIPFGTMTTINAFNQHSGVEVYQFLRDCCHSSIMRFIPVVERVAPDGSLAPPAGHEKLDQEYTLSDSSVSAEGFGKFLTDVFFEWLSSDVERVTVQYPFETLIQIAQRKLPNVCFLAETCGRALTVDHEGVVYPCDHYVFPGLSLGILQKESMAEMVESQKQLNFGKAKRDTLPAQCKRCKWKKFCNGGCPKNRFLTDSYGNPGLNFLCKGYTKFFEKAIPFVMAITKATSQFSDGSKFTEFIKT